MNKNYIPKFTLTLILFLFFYSCASLKKKNNEKKPVVSLGNAEKNYIKQELLIKLNDAENIGWLEEQFDKYKLSSKKEISKSMGIWLMQYDTTLIKPEKMLEKLRKDKFVMEAEFNKKLSSR